MTKYLHLATALVLTSCGATPALATGNTLDSDTRIDACRAAVTTALVSNAEAAGAYLVGFIRSAELDTDEASLLIATCVGYNQGVVDQMERGQ